MKPPLSVIIASYNEPDLIGTLASIRANSPSGVEVVVVDDSSATPVPAFSDAPNTRVIRNSNRIGCGPSRYVGALHATGEWLLFIDAHMRFDQGWYPEWYRNAFRSGTSSEVEATRKILFCGTCVALPPSMNLNEATGEYTSGATWNFCGPHRSGPQKGDPKHLQVFECVWNNQPVENLAEIPAVMGACYFINRDWFLELDCLRHFRLWGGDEQELSLKVWLAGGSIRLLKHVRLGHKFRTAGVGPAFKMAWHDLYNKLFVIHTCFPLDLARILQAKLGGQRGVEKYGSASQFAIALKHLREDWHLVETARTRNLSLFTRDVRWLAQKFGLSLPQV